MSSKRYEGLTMSAIDTSYVVGLMLGPSLGGFLFDLAGTYLPFLVFGCFGLQLLIFTFHLRFLKIFFSVSYHLSSCNLHCAHIQTGRLKCCENRPGIKQLKPTYCLSIHHLQSIEKSFQAPSLCYKDTYSCACLKINI